MEKDGTKRPSATELLVMDYLVLHQEVSPVAGHNNNNFINYVADISCTFHDTRTMLWIEPS